MTRVLVIGAGAAGLAGARRLQALGCDVEVIEASGRVGGHLTELPLCVLDAEAQEALAVLGVRELPSVGASEIAEAGAPSEPVRTTGGWRALARRWLAGLRPRIAAPPPPRAPALIPGAALAHALAPDVPVRFGWEVLDVKGSAVAATVQYVAPSGERSQDADAALVTLPAEPGTGVERRLAIFFTAGCDGGAAAAAATHGAVPPGSEAAHVWILRDGDHGVVRIDLTPEASRALWDADDEELATSVWDLLPADLRLAEARPQVHRFCVPVAAPVDAGDLRVARVPAAGDLGATLRAAVATAEELVQRIHGSMAP